MTRVNPYQSSTTAPTMKANRSRHSPYDVLLAVLFCTVLVGVNQIYARIWSHMGIASIQLSVLTLLLLVIATVVAAREIRRMSLSVLAIGLFWGTVFAEDMLFSEAKAWDLLRECMMGAVVHIAILVVVNISNGKSWKKWPSGPG